MSDLLTFLKGRITSPVLFSGIVETEAGDGWRVSSIFFKVFQSPSPC
jgi:hypothetical protein